MSSALTEKWYALYTKPRNEKKAADLLTQKGYTVYLPLVTTLKQWSDRKKKVQLPLFNSYLFVHTTYEKNHIDILSTPGIVKFVRIGKEIATIRDTQIEYIQTFLTHEIDVQVVSNQEAYKIGEAVHITEGPFRGMKGQIVDYRQSQFFSIAIEQLGANLLVTIPANMLGKV